MAQVNGPPRGVPTLSPAAARAGGEAIAGAVTKHVDAALSKVAPREANPGKAGPSIGERLSAGVRGLMAKVSALTTRQAKVSPEEARSRLIDQRLAADHAKKQASGSAGDGTDLALWAMKGRKGAVKASEADAAAQTAKATVHAEALIGVSTKSFLGLPNIPTKDFKVALGKLEAEGEGGQEALRGALATLSDSRLRQMNEGMRYMDLGEDHPLRSVVREAIAQRAPGAEPAERDPAPANASPAGQNVQGAAVFGPKTRLETRLEGLSAAQQGAVRSEGDRSRKLIALNKDAETLKSMLTVAPGSPGAPEPGAVKKAAQGLARAGEDGENAWARALSTLSPDELKQVCLGFPDMTPPEGSFGAPNPLPDMAAAELSKRLGVQDFTQWTLALATPADPGGPASMGPTLTKPAHVVTAASKALANAGDVSQDGQREGVNAWRQAVSGMDDSTLEQVCLTFPDKARESPIRGVLMAELDQRGQAQIRADLSGAVATLTAGAGESALSMDRIGALPPGHPIRTAALTELIGGDATENFSFSQAAKKLASTAPGTDRTALLDAMVQHYGLDQATTSLNIKADSYRGLQTAQKGQGGPEGDQLRKEISTAGDAITAAGAQQKAIVEVTRLRGEWDALNLDPDVAQAAGATRQAVDTAKQQLTAATALRAEYAQLQERLSQLQATLGTPEGGGPAVRQELVETQDRLKGLDFTRAGLPPGTPLLVDTALGERESALRTEISAGELKVKFTAQLQTLDKADPSLNLDAVLAPDLQGRLDSLTATVANRKQAAEMGLTTAQASLSSLPERQTPIEREGHIIDALKQCKVEVDAMAQNDSMSRAKASIAKNLTAAVPDASASELATVLQDHIATDWTGPGARGVRGQIVDQMNLRLPEALKGNHAAEVTAMSSAAPTRMEVRAAQQERANNARNALSDLRQRLGNDPADPTLAMDTLMGLPDPDDLAVVMEDMKGAEELGSFLDLLNHAIRSFNAAGYSFEVLQSTANAVRTMEG